MYTYIRAHALARSIGSQWKEVDLSKSLLSSVFTVFSKVYLTIHDSFKDEEVIVDLDSFKAAYSGMNLNIEEILYRHGYNPVETIDELPRMKMKYCTYSIRNKAGYRYEPAKLGYQYPPDINSDIQKDIRLTRPGYDTDMKILDTHCLVTVNGYIHKTDSSPEESYILDAVKTLKISNDDRIGILSFLDVGELVKYDINKEDIYPLRRDGTLEEKLIFKIEEDIEDDMFLMVLGGYLIFPEDGIFFRHGDKSFIMDLKKLNYLERILECREYIDISSLEFKTHITEDGNIEVKNLYSDEVIKNYLTMRNSFFVRIKTSNLSIRRYAMKRVIATPGQFISREIPRFPLFVGYGRMVEYWYQKQGERYLVSVPDSYFRNYSLRYRLKKQVQIVDDNLMAQNPIYHEGATMLEIGSYK